MLWRSPSWKLCHVQHGCPVWFFLMARMPGTPPEPPHSCAHCCCNLLVLYQNKSGQADLPCVSGQTEPPARTESNMLKAIFGPDVFIPCLNFFILFLLMGKGNASFFLSQFFKKFPKSVWRYLAKNNKK